MMVVAGRGDGAGAGAAPAAGMRREHDWLPVGPHGDALPARELAKRSAISQAACIIVFAFLALLFVAVTVGGW